MTGITIATAAAQNIVPCMLELGGKSVAIVYSDADMETVIDSVRRRIFFNAGRVCSAMSRLIEHKEIYDEQVDGVAAVAMKFFQPVLSVLKFESDDDAMAIANAPDYVNERFAGSIETPFSGNGKSGYGGENCREALWNYVQTKCIAVVVGE